MNTKQIRLSADERKKQILQATYKLISQNGFKSVSTRMIANEAKINEALIFRYFNKKEDLLTAIMTDIVNIRPAFGLELPGNRSEFVQALKQFEQFFLNINCDDPSLLKIILYAVLENYPVPTEFDIGQQGTFLNWMYTYIEKGKKEWGFDPTVNSLEAICMFMGSVIYYVLETSVIRTIKKNEQGTHFTELFYKILS